MHQRGLRSAGLAVRALPAGRRFSRLPPRISAVPATVRSTHAGPLSTSCADHMGSTWARVQTWDGKKWDVGADWYQADEQILKPRIKAGAYKYLADKKMKRRDPADCQS